MWLRNELNSEVTRCRVVYVGPEESRREQRVGIEFADEAPMFWGSAYEKALATAVSAALRQPGSDVRGPVDQDT